MSKLRLDYFLGLGLKLVNGDWYTNAEHSKGSFNVNNALWSNSEKKGDDKRFITSLAPRKNTGEQPCGVGVPVVVTLNGGEVRAGIAGVTFSFSLNEHSIGELYRVKAWKPDLEALIKMQDEHDKKLAEPKPRRTKTEYVKVDVSAASNYHTNELFFQYGEEKIEPLKEVDAAFFIINQHKLVRKVERELTWQDEVVELYDDGVTLNTTLRELIDMNSEAVINISHLVASMTDNK